MKNTLIQSLVIFTLVQLVVCLSAKVSLAEESKENSWKSPMNCAEPCEASEAKEEKDEGHSVGHRLLFYIPNRILDIFDLFRARVRVGPGIAAGVRATEVVQAYAGTYASLYVGLPGPRMRVMPRSPIGLESHNGIDLSLIEASVDGGVGPAYSPTEFGVGTQLLLVGFDFGIDPYEFLDFAVGLVGLDLRGDDI